MADLSWVPATGKHSVALGSSLRKALKARKGLAPPAAKRGNIPERDFYSFRWGFKPESIDPTKPGTIELKKNKDTGATTVQVERGSSLPNEAHVYTGTEQPAKEWDCILIYDEDTGEYTLEKIESYMTMNYDRRTTGPASRASNSPMPPTPRDVPSPSVDDELFAAASGPQREEEEEESDPDAQLAALALPTSKPSRPTLASSSSTTLSSSSKHTLSAPADEEELHFGQPARPAKRRKPTPPPPTPSPAPAPARTQALAFPTNTAPPPAPAPSASLAFPTNTAALSDSEDEWDEVAAAPTGTLSSTLLEVDEGEDVEDIDASLFEAELDSAAEAEDDEEDFLAQQLSPVTERPKGGPVSLNQWVGGDAGDTSDSDSDSDDD